MDIMKRVAICLLSGGLDSATALYVARDQRYEPIALSINYGQLHLKEIESAIRIAEHIRIEHHLVSVPLPLGGSALLDSNIPIPEERDASEIAQGIPSTYVPARNTIFLSLAASFAE